MTWTYNPQLLSSTSTIGTLMRIRLVLGDTVSNQPMLQDEEIYYVATGRSEINYIAADLADALAARFAGQINTENSELRVSAAARHKQYFNLADRLRKNGPGNFAGGEGNGGVLAEGYFGGTSQIQNDQIDSNDDNVGVDLGMRMDDFSPVDYFK